MKGERIYKFAKSCLGKNMAPINGFLGCVEAVNNVIKGAIGIIVIDSFSTQRMYLSLARDSRFEETNDPEKGDIIISPTGMGNGKILNGHTGIVSENGKIMSNNSLTLKWAEQWDIKLWKEHYMIKGGFPTKFYRIIEDKEPTPQELSIYEQIIAKIREIISILSKKVGSIICYNKDMEQKEQKLGAMVKLSALVNDPEVAKKRLKGFAWELGNMALIASLGFLANNLDLVNLPPAAIAVIALVLNQVTKQLNSKK